MVYYPESWQHHRRRQAAHKIDVDEIPDKGVNMVYMTVVSIRYLVLEGFGAPNFELLQFEVRKGGKTPVDETP